MASGPPLDPNGLQVVDEYNEQGRRSDSEGQQLKLERVKLDLKLETFLVDSSGFNPPPELRIRQLVPTKSQRLVHFANDHSNFISN